jgi:lysophospholipase L1-like esterase
MNGLAVPARLRTLVLGCAIATALALSAGMFATSASAAKPAREGYLAIGDSLAFGYSQQLFNENEATGENPQAFTHGYVDDYRNALGKVSLFNDGCPGETSGSMIGNGPLATVMAEQLGTSGEAPCAYHYVDGLPLHNEYGGTSSQLENVLREIKNHTGGQSAVSITTISLNIGANDQLHQVAKCEAEVKHEFETEGKSKYGGATPVEASVNCYVSHLLPLIKRVMTNIAGALDVIRQGSLFCVNGATSCNEQQKGVNYTGKIIVQGGYDPYGAVFTPGVELLPKSNLLAGVFNFNEAKTVAAFGACFANPQPRFNPSIVGEPAAEPSRLQAFTNMANFSEFAGKKNGPDIHPTPLGYEELANIMKATCG